jgi:GMP reductase
MRDFLFTYDNICLRPKYSELESRSKADTTVNFLGNKFRLPIIPANMQDVISWEIASELAHDNYFYIMHRFGDTKRTEYVDFVSRSIGVKEADRKLLSENIVTSDFLTIDVAHAHHQNVKEMINHINKIYNRTSQKPKIIAGNVATADGYKFLCDLGVDAVKVGIGGGSICSTRYKTGFHIPTATSVYECSKAGWDVPIIADGGATHFGDVAKALVLGADMVMSGRWFAECIDSPAKIRNGKKVYRGSTSFESKGHNKHIEGHTLEITEGCTYKERLDEIEQALQSSISYAGGKDLSAFNNVEWDLLRS